MTRSQDSDWYNRGLQALDTVHIYCPNTQCLSVPAPRYTEIAHQSDYNLVP